MMTATQLPAGLEHGLDIAVLIIGGAGIDAIAHDRTEVDLGGLVPVAAGELVEIGKKEAVHVVIPKTIDPLLPIALAAPFGAGYIAVELVRDKTPVIVQLHAKPAGIAAVAVVVVGIVFIDALEPAAD